MNSPRKTLLSGVKPTGRPHIGNYFGAMRQFVELQDSHDAFIFIANLHALTTVQDRAKLAEYSLDVALDYLAIGLDPKKATLFLQSDTPQVAELAWIFNCLVTVPYLSRAHAFKDAEAKSKEINVGVFDYPVLMAADILLPGANIVPVGKDQKQHVEIARDIAEKFNRIFGETFALPEALILESVQTVPGIDGQKMSKSYGNTIGLFATDEEIRKGVMSIPTDSKVIEEPKDTATDRVFAFHTLFTEGPEFEELKGRYEAGGIGYKESKDILVKNISKFVAPLREKREALAKDKDAVMEILKEGGKKANERAEKKMGEIREKVGTKLY